MNTSKRFRSCYKINKFEEVNSVCDERDSISRERCQLFVDKLVSRTVYLDLIKKGIDEPVFFTVEEIRSLLGRDLHKERLQALINAGIIQPVYVENWHNSSQCRYAFRPLRLVPITLHPSSIKHKVIHNSLNLYYDYKRKDYSKEAKILIGHLRKTKIVCTAIDFFDEVKAIYPNYKKKTEAKGKKPMSLSRYLDNFHYIYANIQGFNSARGKEIYKYISEDDFGNRVHSIITQLPGNIRNKFLRIKGESVIELDLAASQPTLLAKLLYQEHPDNIFFKATNSSMDIYEYLSEIFHFGDRETAKIEVMRMINGRVNGKPHKLLKSVDFKTAEILEKWKDSNHKNVASKLQRKESFIFRPIWRKLNGAGISFVTVHDAVYIPKSKLNVAYQIMKNVLDNHLRGINWNIHVNLNQRLNLNVA